MAEVVLARLAMNEAEVGDVAQCNTALHALDLIEATHCLYFAFRSPAHTGGTQYKQI